MRIKQAEGALQQREAFLDKLINAIPIPVFYKDKNGRYLVFNKAFESFLGKTREDLIGKSVFDISPKCLAEIYHAKDNELFKSEGNQQYESQIKSANGQLRDVIFYKSIFNDKMDSQSTGLIGAILDITERKNAEKEIIRQKLLFETMFHTIPDGVVITNTERRVQLANKGMESTFGYKPEDLLGKSTRMLYSDSDKFQETGEVVFIEKANKTEDLYITRYKHKSGREFSGETFGAKLFDGNKQWIGNLGIMRDITEREQAEIRLQQSQKMEAIGTLAGGIAHDFNNLLFPIVGMAELLLEDLPKDSLEYENVREIYKAGTRAGGLVKQILAFSRQSEHKMTPVRVQSVLKEVLKLSRSTIPADIEIHQDIKVDCGSIKADATQVHQVAMNLITNAYHAVQDNGGTISVTLKQIILGKGELPDSSLEQGQYIVLSVSDTGAGIEPDILGKIFAPYFTTKKKGKGTGLGLAVVFGIMKEHQGDIKVHSELGKGTTFNVYFPLMKKSAKTVSADQVQKFEPGTERILLVDDEISVVKLEGQMLSRLGYRVTEHTKSLDALEIFKANPDNFDLVITDMTMPNMTGDQFAKAILSIKPDIPVIICTGFSERINKEHAEIIGVKGFLMKPVVKFDMAQMVRKVLNKAKVL